MLWWTLKQLRSKDHRARKAAAKKLGESKENRAVDALIDALGDSNSEVRRSVVESLRRIGDERSVQSLVSRLSDSDHHVRKAAAEALIELGWQPQGSAERARFAVALQQWQEAVGIGVKAIEPLLVALRDEDATCREAAADALHKMDDPKALRIWMNALSDRYTVVRLIAANALGRLEDVRQWTPSSWP